ncbi:pirin family protein [Acinetobacter sp. MD2(2019)]|uniref:pirin family protein n=1 Tax=Acinetobacter sp. MD2(2019) TaxID=2605273 RepID=UPI002D1EADAC|nr:pirin family protein [Acinetobacter sp. MD2(2019)]MEB3753237.1 pirin family protein [Acinetobacter sp. MD2(2019)]
MKKIIGMYHTQQQHWVGDGFHVRTLFSYAQLGQALSPFLLLDYAAPEYFTPTQTPRGVGSHPHRGFETVTLAKQGEVAHKDSRGGGGTIQTGDVQWMTAGAGLLHEEFHSHAFSEQGGVLEMVQLWVNLPAKDKMTPGKYQAIRADEIPLVALDNAGSQLRVIAGEYQQQRGAATTFSPVNVWDVQFAVHQQHQFRVPKGHTTLLVVLSGEVQINQAHIVQPNSVVLFDREDEQPFLVHAMLESECVILTGEPLNEPIQGYGPFVMNTQEEIMRAFHDFQSGQFGVMD